MVTPWFQPACLRCATPVSAFVLIALASASALAVECPSSAQEAAHRRVMSPPKRVALVLFNAGSGSGNPHKIAGSEEGAIALALQRRGFAVVVRVNRGYDALNADIALLERGSRPVRRSRRQKQKRHHCDPNHSAPARPMLKYECALPGNLAAAEWKKFAMLTPLFRSDRLRNVRFFAPFVFVGFAPAAMISIGHPAVAQDAATYPVAVTKAAVFSQVSPNSFVKPESLNATTYNVTVGVCVTMYASGRLRVDVTRSSGYPALDDAVMGACARIRFNPATQNGEAVDFVQPFSFHLTNKG